MTLCVLFCPAGILDQSAVWVDEMNYYDMRTNRNKGISPLSLRPSNPLGIELDKYGLRTQKYTCTHTKSHNHTSINTLSLVTESSFTSLNRNKLTPYAAVLKYYANAATAKMPLTAARREWKQSNCVWNEDNERLGFGRNWSSGPHFCTSSRVLPPTLSGRNGRRWAV